MADAGAGSDDCDASSDEGHVRVSRCGAPMASDLSPREVDLPLTVGDRAFPGPSLIVGAGGKQEPGPDPEVSTIMPFSLQERG